MLNYITQLNAFENLCTEILPPKAQLIYYKLFKWSNRFGLGEPFQISNLTLMLETGISDKKTFIANRNILKQRGFIDFEPGKKGSPTKYVLVDLKKYGSATLPNTPPNTPPFIPPNSPPNIPPNSPSYNDFLPIEKNKNKTKTKQNGLFSPQIETNFEAFWKEYPRKVGKGDARKAFSKTILKGVSLETLLEALRKQKRCTQWNRDNGRYIPHPSTWLNQERWEDEVDDNGDGTGYPEDPGLQRLADWEQQHTI